MTLTRQSCTEHSSVTLLQLHSAETPIHSQQPSDTARQQHTSATHSLRYMTIRTHLPNMLPLEIILFPSNEKKYDPDERRRSNEPLDIQFHINPSIPFFMGHPVEYNVH